MKLRYRLVFLGCSWDFAVPAHAQAASAPDWLKLIKAAPVPYRRTGRRAMSMARAYRRIMAGPCSCTALRRGVAMSPAQYQLGWMYANGRGVARDDARQRLGSVGGGERAMAVQQMLARVNDPAKIVRATCAEPVDPTRRPSPTACALGCSPASCPSSPGARQG
jgi:hypothetical protein